MRARVSFALAAAVLSVGFPLSAATGFAMVIWTSNGVPVRGTNTSGAADNVSLAPDGSGGGIASWRDDRCGGDTIYAQKVDASGSPIWTEDGVELCGSGMAFGPITVSDDAGGAIVVWVDYRTGSGNLFAQRVDPSGTPLWTADGVHLASADAHAGGHHASPDGSGGAIVTWNDNRDGYLDIYAQRVDSSGKLLWGPGGVVVRGALGPNAYEPQITTDGAGGAIVTWRDIRGGPYAMYVQRVDADGDVLWTPGGVVLRSTDGYAWTPQIAADGAGGAIVTWRDLRAGVGDVYAQKVNSTGAAQWTENGVALRVIPGSDAHSPQITADGSGGAIVCWADERGANTDVYAQRVDSDGVVQWAENGIAFRQISDGNADAPKPVSDGAGGMIVSWEDTRSGDRDIYAQRVDPDGVVQWDADGLAVRQLAGSDAASASSRIVTDGAQGAVVVWGDDRHGQRSVYMQRVNDSDLPVAGFGSALDLAMGPRYITVPGHADINLAGSSPFTLSMWVYPRTFDAEPTLYFTGPQAGPNKLRLWLRILANGVLRLGFDKEEVAWQWFDLPEGTMQSNRWTHISVSKSEYPVNIYINGELALSDAIDGISHSATVEQGTKYIGGDTVDRQFDGLIDEFQFWNTALSADAIRNWMYREIDSTHPHFNNLKLYYKLNEGEGSVAADSAGDNHGTLVNMENEYWVDSTIRDWHMHVGETMTGYFVGSWTDGSSSNGLDWTLGFNIAGNGALGTATASLDDNSFLYTATNHGIDTIHYTVTNFLGAVSPPYPVEIHIAPPAPNALPAADIGETSFRANWVSVDGATGYALDVATNSLFADYIGGYDARTVADVMCVVTGTTPGQVYFYRVRAAGDGGFSSNSAAVGPVAFASITNVEPSSCSWIGGCEVVISGPILGYGGDITNVTLAGVSVDSIVSQSSTQVIVVAGAALAAGLGDVSVYSMSFGETVASDAFEYLREQQAPLMFEPVTPQVFASTNALSVTGGSGTGAVSFGILSGPGLIVDSTNLTVTAGSGTIEIRATKGQDDLYHAASVTGIVEAAKATAQVFLQDLAQTYNGTARAVSATTDPPGLTVEFTYDGNAWAPINTGSYAVVGNVNEANWQGSAGGTLVVTRPSGTKPTDFGGEGLSDVSIYLPETGWWFAWSPMNWLVAWEEQWGGPDTIPVPSDYNGDRIADLAVYHEPTGWWYGRTLAGELLFWEEQWGGPGSIPVPDDFSGDGIADLVVYHEATGYWYGRTLAGELLFWEEQWGGPDTIPVPADYNGDGIADLAVYHRPTGWWYGRTLAGELLFWEEQWGGPGAVPVPGDYTGNGIADLVVYHEETGYWYGRTLDGELILWEEQWGGPGAIPVPGDFSGNGIADLAVYVDGLWFVTTLDGTVLYWEDRWGGPESVPLGR